MDKCKEMDELYYRLEDDWKIIHEVNRPQAEDVLISIDELYRAVDWAQKEYRKARCGPDKGMKKKFRDIHARLFDQVRYAAKKYDQYHQKKE